MTKKDFAALKASLRDAVAYLNGDKSRGRATVIDVAALDVGVIRNKVGLSQDDFASAFGVSVGTLRNWEQGRNRPDGPARALLTVIDRDPAAVLKALGIPLTPRKAARAARGARSSSATRRAS
jgi:putative transcriptional regulator